MSEGPTVPAEGATATAIIDSHRLEAFSDSVMAVIITIMAFDLRTPATPDLNGLAHRVAPLLVYVLSFTVIGIYWNNHHHLLRATERISGAVTVTNLPSHPAPVLARTRSLRCPRCPGGGSCSGSGREGCGT